MTYCFAWKADDEIYIVADSLTSSENNDLEVEADYSSMGEKYGEYNSRFVAETDIKIYIKDNYVIAFSGYLDTYEEIKSKLNLMVGLPDDQIISYLMEIVSDGELILAIHQKDNNKLFVLNKREVKEITNYISIGSGRAIGMLDDLMKRFSKTFPDFKDETIDDKPRKKISAATAYLQMISLKNNFLEHGVGGTICGVCIYDNKIEWNDDLLYFFYDENFKNKKLINMIIRNNNILTGSDFTGLTKLFRFPEVDDKLDEVSMRKLVRSMHKNMSSHIPRYIVFYSTDLNNIYFYDTHRKTQTSLVRMFQRRSSGKIKWEIFTIPFLISNFLLQNNNKEELAPPFHYLEGLPVPYESRDYLIENTENIEDIEFEYDYFDQPLENIQINIDIEKYFKFGLEDYENLIIVNFEYLEEKIIELRNFYKGLNIQFDSSKILKKLCEFLKKEWGVDKFEILVFSKNYQFFYEKIDDLELNLIKNKNEYSGFLIKLLHNYYVDHRYFHLNKIFIIDDSSDFNDLFEILPDYNKNREEADIFIIKNQNGESEVLYSPYHYNADILFSQLSGLSYEALGLWSPLEYSEDELEGIRKYINEQIDNSKI
ncbi:hypothetical protein PB01_08185 [Psychrobacillus glaciei]|uniref:Uncharacterized protein n=1 Tax=Psychrobacillus glaciei TaxID=2283160 RepID=A0A5J6SMZ2_9BACI|nr:hypothetical protein [Psychrobacillus glaciei]QFF98813.1 hypothetical protein PB01_08185 [Psychrobacillus glaciei]